MKHCVYLSIHSHLRTTVYVYNTYKYYTTHRHTSPLALATEGLETMTASFYILVFKHLPLLKGTRPLAEMVDSRSRAREVQEKM